MIIDFHTHYFPPKVAAVAVPKLAAAIATIGVKPVTAATLESNLLHADNNGVDIQVGLNIAVTPKQEESITRSVVQCDNPRIIPFGSVHPASEGWFATLDALKAAGIKGIKIHPEYQNVNVDDSSFFPIYERCAQLGLLISVHCGWDVAYPDSMRAGPEALAKLLKLFPSTDFVFAHMGGMKRWDGVLESIAGKRCYLDTSMCAGYLAPELFKRIVNKHGVDNILYGSDLPWQDEGVNMRYVLSMGYNDSDNEKILGGNAAALLRIRG